MKEQIISFETAKLARDKGFNWSSQITYDGVGKIMHESWNSTRHPSFSPVPTQSLLQKWLREKHDTHIEVICYLDPDSKKSWYDSDVHSSLVKEEKSFDTVKSFNIYEEALENALKEALKLITV